MQIETMNNEAIELAQKLLQAESVSPNDGGLHLFIGNYLLDLGFQVEHLDIDDTKNLYAKIGFDSSICFAGHTDVVPPGKGWKHDPYAAVIENGYLFGRGANDMKTSIACAMIAFKYLLKKNPNLSLSMLLTSDEEASAANGLKKIVPKLIDRNEKIKLFILGEPSAKTEVADTVKIGRRGSITAVAKIFGIQGHIAYPELSNNPIPYVAEIAKTLQEFDFNDEDEYFGATKIQTTNIDSFNHAMNVIPGIAELRFGTRFNKFQTQESIKQCVNKIFEEVCGKANMKYEIDWLFHGNPFICKDSNLLNWLSKCIEPVLLKSPLFDAKGATSDGRFLTQLAPCFEIGFQEDMAHKVDERVCIEDISKLLKIYLNIFENIVF